MPDPNKHAALQRRGFKIAKVCGLCCHWATTPSGNNWGQCNLALYEHAKHGAKLAGTPDYGTCEKHVFDTRCVEISAGRDYTHRYLPRV